MNVRRGRADDFDRWLALFEAVAAEGRWIGTEAPVDPEPRRAGIERALRGDGAAWFVAEDGDQLVGSLHVHMPIPGIADLGMVVAESHRGRGVGTLLLAACLDWAREVGAHKVQLQAWPHNEAAIRLYRRFGFVEEGRLRRHYRRRSGELWDAVVMGLVLDEESPGSPYGG